MLWVCEASVTHLFLWLPCLSPNSCVHTEDHAVGTGSPPPPPWWGIALICLIMGARCQGIKGSWTRQKDCHSDLLLNSRALALFVFCENQIFTNILSKVQPAASLQWKPAKEGRLPGSTLEGCICHSSLSCLLIGLGWGRRVKNKEGKKNL